VSGRQSVERKSSLSGFWILILEVLQRIGGSGNIIARIGGDGFEVV